MINVYVRSAMALDQLAALVNGELTRATVEGSPSADPAGGFIGQGVALTGSEQPGDVVLITRRDAEEAVGLRGDILAGDGDDSATANIGTDLVIGVVTGTIVEGGRS